MLPSYSDAKCLDGSGYGYYIREGSSDNFLLFFEGGGWCYDQQFPITRNGTISDCRSRSNGNLGSSNRWGNTRSYGGMMSNAESQNPNFHDYTLVYLPYCDGASFSGNAVTDGLSFKGAANLDALLDDLKQTTSIQSAPQVVLSGGSAGGTTVLYHADKISATLATSGEIVAMPDAGFFLDLPNVEGQDIWPDQMRSLFSVADGYDDLDADCLARFPNDKQKCLFPEYYGDTIDTRFFILNSYYDSSEMWYTLELDCCPAGCSGYPTCQAGSSSMDGEFQVQ
jgi:hypothetical protein